MDQLLREDYSGAAAVPTPTPGDGSSLLPKVLKETTLTSARLHVAAVRKEVEEITCAAAEKQREADTNKSCYFEAHDQAVEESISSEGPG